ncbi:MAG: hypothetical protein KKF10_02470, partial [Verrucomicrobia bacterium]|nr:hypothetical protein [Verrucomicrobiota bacterium]
FLKGEINTNNVLMQAFFKNIFSKKMPQPSEYAEMARSAAANALPARIAYAASVAGGRRQQ